MRRPNQRGGIRPATGGLLPGQCAAAGRTAVVLVRRKCLTYGGGLARPVQGSISSGETPTRSPMASTAPSARLPARPVRSARGRGRRRARSPARSRCHRNGPWWRGSFPRDGKCREPSPWLRGGSSMSHQAAPSATQSWPLGVGCGDLLEYAGARQVPKARSTMPWTMSVSASSQPLRWAISAAMCGRALPRRRMLWPAGPNTRWCRSPRSPRRAAPPRPPSGPPGGPAPWPGEIAE